MIIPALPSGGFHSAAAKATIGIVALAPNKASKQKVNFTDAPRSISRYVFNPAARATWPIPGQLLARQTSHAFTRITKSNTRSNIPPPHLGIEPNLQPTHQPSQ